MAEKLYDMAVKTGEYTNSYGETKGRYENIGSMMKGDNGPFLLLKKTFNPAGVATREGYDNVIVSLFKPKEREDGGFYGRQGQHDERKANGYAPDAEFEGALDDLRDMGQRGWDAKDGPSRSGGPQGKTGNVPF